VLRLSGDVPWFVFVGVTASEMYRSAYDSNRIGELARSTNTALRLPSTYIADSSSIFRVIPIGERAPSSMGEAGVQLRDTYSLPFESVGRTRSMNSV
jgi:hypothetical protein